MSSSLNENGKHINGDHSNDRITNTTTTTKTNYSNFPKDVGILAIDIYFPTQYVSQEKLEIFDKVSTGKYTIGLGQSKMSFCLDNEDINSICLTVLNNMMEKYSIQPEEIGRLDVGTETLIDKSKSVKTCLMSLFEKCDNTDLEGVDNVNACFGGTAALFNAINWIESSYWDGRYAAVVMGDIALYAKGSARPTGGAGAIALLIGPNAPLVFERGLRATHISHAYDFYKPVMDSEYPVVDGKLSVICYLNALDRCYQLYKKKFYNLYNSQSTNDLNNNYSNNLANNVNKNYNKRIKLSSDNEENKSKESSKLNFNLNASGAFLFHSPYCKLVQKSFARLFWNDYLEYAKLEDNPGDNNKLKALNLDKIEDLEKFKKLTNEESFVDKNLEKELVRLSEPLFKLKTFPSLTFAKEIGNMYTPSLYACLISHLLSKPSNELNNTRICLFSYGSGLASAMFSILVNDEIREDSNSQRFTLNNILNILNQQKKILTQNRIEIQPELYDSYLNVREINHKKPSREPVFSSNSLYPGTWYLKSIDENYRRYYERKTASNESFDLKSAHEMLNNQLSQLEK